MVLKENSYSFTLEACKVTQHKHQQAPYVGGELNLIRVSKNPVFSLFQSQCGKPSKAKVSLNTSHFFHGRYYLIYLKCRDIAQYRNMFRLESYWKDVLFRYRADFVATTTYQSKISFASKQLNFWLPDQPVCTLACPCNWKPLAQQPNCCIT